MVTPQFQRIPLTEDLEILNYSIYKIPEGTTHIGVKNGKIGFFVSDCNGSYKSSNNRRFIKLPFGPKPKAVCFPFFGKKADGCFYGCPQFLY